MCITFHCYVILTPIFEGNFPRLKSGKTEPGQYRSCVMVYGLIVHVACAVTFFSSGFWRGRETLLKSRRTDP